MATRAGYQKFRSRKYRLSNTDCIFRGKEYQQSAFRLEYLKILVDTIIKINGSIKQKLSSN